jgi:hypothetical protein
MVWPNWSTRWPKAALKRFVLSAYTIAFPIWFSMTLWHELAYCGSALAAVVFVLTLALIKFGITKF